MKTLLMTTAVALAIVAGPAIAVPSDWVKVGKDMYTCLPNPTSPGCVESAAKDAAFYATDIDGMDDDDGEDD